MVIAVEGGFVHEEEEEDDRPIRYLPIGHVYSSSAPAPCSPLPKKPRVDDGEPPMKVYYRRRRKKPRVEDTPPSPSTAPPAPQERDEDEEAEAGPSRRKGSLKHELLGLGSAPPALDGDGDGDVEEPGRRRGRSRRGGGVEKTVCLSEPERRRPGRPKGSSVGRRWVELEIDGADPRAFVRLACKVFWPLDDDWYKGSITGYNEATKKHSVKYDDGEAEDLSLADERIKFSVSSEEMKSLNLKFGISNQDKKGYDELLALAVSFHDYQGLDPGDLVWAKITGHAMWPAVVVDESNVPAKALKPVRLDQSILVQFFGTHDFARIKLKQAVPFLNGLVSSLHLKCKQASFCRSLEEAKEFLRTQQLPEIMLQLRKSVQHDGSDVKSCEDGVDSFTNLSEDRATQNGEDYAEMTQIELGNLRVSNLGRIVSDSDHFHNKKHIWPEGYTALRKFTSIKDPHLVTSYKMEVLRNSDTKARPLFRVTSEDGVQIDGSTPNACWKEIYCRIKEKQCNVATDLEINVCQRSGSYMFGFSNPQIRQLIQELPNARSCLKYFENGGDTILGYRAVHVNWKDLDYCNVCDMDEEYEDNLFLQCDKCRMMVHARCYGELEPLDGVLWLCNLCRPGAPRVSPRCCLCPVTGGAMKPTTDGRWAHLACAIWIPETCLQDVKRMEPIDGLSRINKDRWKLLCSICGVSYGACIQCSHPTCRVAYHPLCARAADLCVELEDDDKIHLMLLDEDEDPCIRLLSYCKKHRQPSTERPSLKSDPAERAQVVQTDLASSSGCARTEPYNFHRRRGQKQPQVMATASLKRLYVENMPYIVSGYCQDRVGNHACSEPIQPAGLSDAVQQEAFGNVSSMVEKYTSMKATFRKRLTFERTMVVLHH
ncbi:histone-lysine N-methyltransferase TRX1-like isoform X2 [Phragmites australis]|uniref:histone-lysine N-methyltransferase TRX1-like isoform X2 n=1 Tax=Phragmites australis TaxID=29695 RepID=UPI002D7779B5|nr:histone-lysine N-methyltransferase TRX1-like isoform X2 [Phragmites australis]